MHRSNSQRCQINQKFGGEVNIYSRLKRTKYSSTYMYEKWPIVCLALLKSREGEERVVSPPPPPPSPANSPVPTPM